MDNDIKEVVYKEPEVLNFRFNYDTDGCRRLTNLTKQSLVKKMEQKQGYSS